MRRPLLVLVALGALVTGARAQSERVSVTLTLEPDEGRGAARRPNVYLRHLLDDSRWRQALDNSLPISVSYRLELWRSREGWIDDFTSSAEWRLFLTKEPLQEEYTITLVFQDRPQRPIRFAERDSAASYLGRGNRVEFLPTRPGRYYYTLTVRITALTDADMDQLERFLAGDPDLDATDGSSPVGRGIRRFLLRLAGLRSEVLQARSEVFEVTRE